VEGLIPGIDFCNHSMAFIHNSEILYFTIGSCQSLSFGSGVLPILLTYFLFLYIYFLISYNPCPSMCFIYFLWIIHKKKYVLYLFIISTSLLLFLLSLKWIQSEPWH
jgi:hypothetical protein